MPTGRKTLSKGFRSTINTITFGGKEEEEEWRIMMDYSPPLLPSPLGHYYSYHHPHRYSLTYSSASSSSSLPLLLLLLLLLLLYPNPISHPLPFK